MTTRGGQVASRGMSNVLSDDKRQQIIALGRLGWSLRRIEQATGVRRETASGYLKAAGIQVRVPGSPSLRQRQRLYKLLHGETCGVEAKKK